MEKTIEQAKVLWRDNNEIEAITLLNSIANESGPANTLIGNMYSCAQKGLSNVKRDYKKAREYYKKSVDLNDSEGAIELGKLYFFGDGVKQNYDKAELYWGIAYELGDELGAFELANYYYDCKTEKIDKAINIYKELIAQNEFVENSLLKLSRIYGRGIGIEKNSKLELKYLNEGIKYKDFNCCSDLAYKYFTGDGIPKDLDKALQTIQKADTRELFVKDKAELVERIKNEIRKNSA